jgi:hypothetical protein
MKRILCLAALVGAAAMSHAQLNMQQPTNLAFRLGIGLPFDEETRDHIGSTLLGVGVDYFFERALIPSANGETYISIDWLARGSNGEHGNMFPIMLNQRWYAMDDNPNDDRRTYFFAGLGAAFMDIDESDTVLAGRVGLGAELGPNIFGEANLVLTGPDSGGFHGTGINFYVGYRF